MSLLELPVSKNILDFSPLWTPIIEAKFRKIQICAVWIIWKIFVFKLFTYLLMELSAS
jgi:hypothetical protein